MSATSTESPSPPAGMVATYRTMLRWNLAGVGGMLPLIIVVQAVLAGGIILGFGFLVPESDVETVLLLCTGAPVILLLTVGFVMVPQSIARSRADGTYDYVRSLPVARGLILAADLTVWLLVALPGVAVGVLTALWRYDLTLSIDWPLLVLACLLVTIMATAVGNAMAVSVPPLLAQLLSQVLVFFVMLFSPITFPANRLPNWLESLHSYLPIQSSADLIRAGLASNSFDAQGRDLIVVVLWCLAGLALTTRALIRRN